MARWVGLLFIVAAAAPAAADSRVPHTLHMRRIAQTPPADTEPPPPLTTDQNEVIVVHGSTVEHDLFTGRTPMSVVTREDLEASGRAMLGDILQALPSQANGGNAQVNAGGDGTTRINLRGLGADRTLVLVNGRRFINGGPGADAAVDVNAIPLAMIDRVEVSKDGASALYGAEAIGGVVNVITRRQFDGGEVSLLTSGSQRGDGSELDASIVQGYTSDDKDTYAVVSAGYQRHGAERASDRAFSDVQKTYDFATRTETRLSSLAGPSGRLDASATSGGAIAVPGCTSGICKPSGNGGWTDYTPSDLYNEASSTYLYTPSDRYNLFASGGWRQTPHRAFFTEVLYQQRDSDRQLSPVPFVANIPISKDSIYNPFGVDLLDYRRRITELGPREYHDSLGIMRVIAGLRGSVPTPSTAFEGWQYELSLNYGQTQAAASTTGQLFLPHVADAIGPSMVVNGTPICVKVPGDASTQIIYTINDDDGPPQKIPCVPLNLLAPAGKIPLAQLKLLSYADGGRGDDTSQGLLAIATSPVSRLAHHGSITGSVGANVRDEAGTHAPPSVASSGDSTDNQAQATDADFTIAEGFGEATIVPIADDAIAHKVELDLGARAISHSHSGSSLTYTAGGLFRTVGDLTLRGTYATAFRAPTFFDLYGGRLETTPNAEDPCDARPPSGTKTLDPMVQAQCLAHGVPAGTTFDTGQQIAVTGGNADLKPETASTASLGVVFEPLAGLAVSADYWHITIRDAIETLGIQTIFANCYERGVEAFCNQIHRDVNTHRIYQVDQFLQNIPHTRTSGVDVAVFYDAKLGELGRIHTGLEGQYLLTYDLDTGKQIIHGAGFYDLGVFPRYKANLSSMWSHPSGAGAGFILRYIGSYRECASDDCNLEQNLATARDVDRYFKLDLFGSYTLHTPAGTTTVQLGVNNVLDATPPLIYNAPAANSDATAYDFLGRMVYMRISERY